MKTTEMTLQDMFNTAYTTLQARGWTRATGPLGCAYRSSIGPCAIGACIPDELYLPEMEGKEANNPIIAGLFPLVNIHIMNNLQERHDNGLDPAEMQAKFRDFANRYGLTIPEGQS